MWVDVEVQFYSSLNSVNLTVFFSPPEEKNHLSLSGMQPEIFSRPARSLVTPPTELSRPPGVR